VAPLVADGLQLAVRSVFVPGVLAARWVAQRAVVERDEIPAVPRSLALAAKGVLDEVFFLTEVLSARVVSLRERHRLADETAAALALFRARGWLAAPATYHPTPPALEAVELREARPLLRHPYLHVSWESGYAPHEGEPGRERWLGWTANHTAHAWLLRHPGPPRPWLVCIHGYRTGYPLADFVGFSALWLHRTLGLNVALPVLPLHGPRTVGRRSGDGFITGDYLDTVHMQAQAVWDIRRLLSWLRMDGTPVGAYGVSLGGYTTALLAALDDGLDCVIAGMPAADWLQLLRWNVPAVLLGLAERAGVRWDHVADVLRVVAPLALPPRVPAGRCYLFAGLGDRLVPPHLVRALWRHWGRPRLLWYDGSHVSFGLEPAVRRLLREAVVRTGLAAA
jgi:hypothetical protein